MSFEFLIPKRPVSLQVKNRGNLQKWKDFVRNEAAKTWTGTQYDENFNLHLMLVYLYDANEVALDVDNIIKPIQDALVGLIYSDDSLITDVASHRRSLTGIFDIAKYPNLLVQGILSGDECVYVRISESQPLEIYL